MKTTESNQENLTNGNATFHLEEIKKGMHICWNVSAQAGFDSTTIIGDDKMTYGKSSARCPRTPKQSCPLKIF